METQEILAKLELAGVFFAVEGGNLKLRSPAKCPPSPELVEQLREHKAEALSILRERGKSTSESKDRPATGDHSGQLCNFATPIPCKTAKLKEAPYDPYSQAADAALETLRRMNLPAGVRLWMQRERPDLDLQEQGLFSLAARLWQEHAPLEQFESVLAEWVSCFRVAESFYKQGEPWEGEM